MSSKKKKKSSPAQRVYTTRQIMEITEKRRQKDEAGGPKPAEPLLKTENKSEAAADLNKKEPAANFIPAQELLGDKTRNSRVENITEEGPVHPPAPIANRSLLFLNLALAAFLLVISLKFPVSWVNAVSEKLNSMIVYGCSLVFSIAHWPCGFKGVVFSTPYYRISLQGDLAAYGSAELLMFFAVFFALIQKTTWPKKLTVFLTLVPLVLFAGIFRLLWACGLALNYNKAFADQCFHGALVNFALVFVVLGLIFVELMFSPD